MEHCGYVVQVKELRKHSNADRLQVATFFGNDTIVSIETNIGDIGVYFPSDLQLSERFCQVNDLVRRKNPETGKSEGGYMDPEKRNVKAIKLRGEKSDGIYLPITCLADFCTISDLQIGDTISVVNGEEICRKYIPQSKRGANWHNGVKERKPRQKIAPTFYEHVDTAQLAYNLSAFKVGDIVELTLKMHGTSGRTGYLPLRHYKQSWLDKLLKKPGKQYMEYGYITGTRRVVLDAKHDGGFYDDNSFRLAMAKKFEGKLHKGEVVYYEIVGFVNSNTPIMASVPNSKISDKAFTQQYGETTVFSYGCNPTGTFEDHYYHNDIDGEVKCAPRCQVYVYRMTMVNEDGEVVEYSPEQMRLRCDQMDVNYVPVFEKFMIPETETDYCDNNFVDTITVNPGEYVLRKVEQYFDGPDPVGKTHIREGVVARIVNRPSIAVYKHKNFNFKVLEGIAKDEAIEPDIEEAQELIENKESEEN